MGLPRLFENPEEGANELGAAMHHLAFNHILELLEAYEERILVIGIDDPDQTKDFLRGAVHAARSMRTSLIAAKQYFDRSIEQEKAEAKKKRDFLPPGSGSVGMS